MVPPPPVGLEGSKKGLFTGKKKTGLIRKETGKGGARGENQENSAPQFLTPQQTIDLRKAFKQTITENELICRAGVRGKKLRILAGLRFAGGGEEEGYHPIGETHSTNLHQGSILSKRGRQGQQFIHQKGETTGAKQGVSKKIVPTGRNSRITLHSDSVVECCYGGGVKKNVVGKKNNNEDQKQQRGLGRERGRLLKKRDTIPTQTSSIPQPRGYATPAGRLLEGSRETCFFQRKGQKKDGKPEIGGGGGMVSPKKRPGPGRREWWA